MCGFAGFCPGNFFSRNDLVKIIEKMNLNITNRGPDSSNIYINEKQKVAIGHTRLSIIDLSKKGNQPMKDHSGRYILAYNGEIYNFIELKKKIEKQHNINWKSSTDTEVLLESISVFGIEKTLNLIEGMFAFALYDSKNNNIFLARDITGQKPLYYGVQNNNLFFSSDIKSIKNNNSFDEVIDMESINLFLEYNYIPSPKSIFKNIFKLEPGNYLKIDLVSMKIKKNTYWQLNTDIDPKQSNFANKTDNQLCLDLNKLLNKNISKMMYADVNIGSFLSGGIDSSLVTSIMQQNSNYKINTFSLGYEDNKYDESNKATIIAKHLNTNHNNLIFKDFMLNDIIYKLPDIYSEPFADSSQIPSILISQFAKKNDNKVVFTGDGADELFGGYNRAIHAQKIYNFINFLPTNIRHLFFKFLNKLSQKNIEFLFKYITRDKFLTDKIFKSIKLFKFENKKDFVNKILSYNDEYDNFLKEKKYYNHQLKNKKFLNKNSDINKEIYILDFLYYLSDDILCKVDRATMHSGVESRAPFLEKDIIDFSINLKERSGLLSQKKIILKKILKNYLPEKLFLKPKQGFAFPIDNIFRGNLKILTNDIINEKNHKFNEIFEIKTIKSIFAEHQNKNHYSNSLWSILILKLWFNKL